MQQSLPLYSLKNDLLFQRKIYLHIQIFDFKIKKNKTVLQKDHENIATQQSNLDF